MINLLIFGLLIFLTLSESGYRLKLNKNQICPFGKKENLAVRSAIWMCKAEVFVQLFSKSWPPEAYEPTEGKVVVGGLGGKEVA